MLKEITSKNYEFHKSNVDPLLDFLKIYQSFRLSSEERDKATFLIAEDDQRGVYGGAVLYPQKISPSLALSPSDTREKSLRKMFSAFQPEGQEYWTARICLCAAWETSTPILEIEKLLECFYQNLYQSFAQFGKKKGIEYLTLTHRTIDPHIDNILNIVNWR